jgi:alcohol oxidase
VSFSSTLPLFISGHVLITVCRGKRAVGVEYVPNPIFQPNANRSLVRSVRAKKLVVVSAGTFGSPAILERSGIGGKDILDKAGVQQIVDLPGVGEHYQGAQLLLEVPS